MTDPRSRTLVDLLDEAAARWAGRTAWTFDLTAAGGGVEELTFAQVGERTTRLAAGLAALGVEAGDRVGVVLGNHPAFPLTWFALQRLGAAMVPLNPRYGPVDAAHLLHDAAVDLVVAWPEHADLLAAAGAPRVVAPEEVEEAGAVRPAPQAPVDAPVAGPVMGPETVVNVQYTSGTTGRPKGCLLTHAYWTHLAASMVEEFPHLVADDVLLTAQPFHYVDPQWNVVAALVAGARLVVLDGFHPSTFWESVHRHGVTYFYCLAAMPTLLLAMPPSERDRELAAGVRAVQCSAIPPARHAEIEARWGVPWSEAFGMTETGADLRVGAEEHDELVGSGCVGRPTGHREARLDEAGQLWLRGPGMMLGYLGHPSPFDDEGWFPTGDLARLDDAGRVHLTGRLKDMIRRSGENIAAVEVEEVLRAHPAVEVVAVLGVPDELRGEEVLAAVVAPGADAETLRAWCAERLAPFKVPTRWVLRDALPMTASHRVAKAELRAELLAEPPVEPPVDMGRSAS